MQCKHQLAIFRNRCQTISDIYKCTRFVNNKTEMYTVQTPFDLKYIQNMFEFTSDMYLFT